MNQYQFEENHQKLRHCIYIDNNLFRLLKREPELWYAFFHFFEKNDPNLFQHIQLLFTWSQLLEDIDLGNVMGIIHSNPAWSKACNRWNNIQNPEDIISINKALDDCFQTAYNIIKNHPDLNNKNDLISKIDASIAKHAEQHSNILVQETLLKAKKFIETHDDFINDIALELAWAFITSYPFVTSNKKWEMRSKYFDALIHLWHQEFLKGNELCLYRIIANRSKVCESFLRSEHKELNYSYHIGHTDDLCDAEGIHFIALGCYDHNSAKRRSVTFITTDNNNDIEQRVAIKKQALEELKKVENWKVTEVPGEVITIKLSADKKDIISANRIPYNAPFHQPKILNN